MKKKTLPATRFFSLRLGWFFHLLSATVDLFRVSSPFKLSGQSRYLLHCAAARV